MYCDLTGVLTGINSEVVRFGNTLFYKETFKRIHEYTKQQW